MDVREKYVMQKVNRKEKSICPNCIHHNLCIAENNQPCFECNRFIDAHGVTVQDNTEISDELLERLRKAPVTVMTEEPTVEVVQEWISVKEPPKERGEYLCYFNYEPESPDVICQNTYYGSGLWMSESSRVTHWQYLPQPPKGE